MKKAYIAPACEAHSLMMEDGFLLSLSTNDSSDGEETGGSDALSTEHSWSSDDWGSVEE